MSENILHFPDHMALENEVRQLMDELVDLIVEVDEMTEVEQERISDDYLAVFGAAECRIAQAEYHLHRLERKLELIRGRKLLPGSAELTQVEHRLDRELEHELELVEEKRRGMTAMLRRRRVDHSTDVDARDFRETYRTIVRRTHPDLHDDLTEETYHHYSCARQALHSGDLLACLMLMYMYDDPVIVDDRKRSTQALLQEREKLMGKISSMRETLRRQQESFPFCMQALLADDQLRTEHAAELEDKLRRTEARCTAKQAEIEHELTAGHTDKNA